MYRIGSIGGEDVLICFEHLCQARHDDSSSARTTNDRAAVVFVQPHRVGFGEVKESFAVDQRQFCRYPCATDVSFSFIFRYTGLL
ncbi:uncharacterized protein SPSK_02081 [Sporothrix schenckii 1099-18]|uniref:Uncharacterized protein n=1 Tax=Sporothrix schenckii 1099-18 TaxID=1397361 RepID=A0A0F2MBN1_SPOSC|nr:uncharacterized protein SPSK_02081 [Sporothrix schenckii 1099-18]KJR87042.1 hypothetical protein SPSK_02081 [Sporothrix schenckii 1099-18]